MPDIRVMMTIGFDEHDLPTKDECDAIVGNLKEHVAGEINRQLPGFEKAVRARIRSIEGPAERGEAA